MKLNIDGLHISARCGETLLGIIKRSGLDSEAFSHKPIAAKIAGELFNLNYIPVRQQDVQPDRPSIRRAMAASGGDIHLIRYQDPQGRDVYNRTAQFVLFLALHRLYPFARAKMNCTVGRALYIEVRHKDFSADALIREVSAIVAEDIPLVRERVALEDAIAHFHAAGQQDNSQLLSHRKEKYFDQYSCCDFSDYYYGELAPSTGYLQVWNIIPVDGGFMFLYPDDNTHDIVAEYEQMQHFLQVSTEGERWC